MSFVTTPIRRSWRRDRQSAAISELLPEPTGPPMPTRNARSGGKEPPFPTSVCKRPQLVERGERRRKLARRQVEGDRGERHLFDLVLELGEEPRRREHIDRQELHGRGGDSRGVVVEKDPGELELVETRGARDDAERDRSRRRRARHPVGTRQSGIRPRGGSGR